MFTVAVGSMDMMRSGVHAKLIVFTGVKLLSSPYTTLLMAPAHA